MKFDRFVQTRQGSTLPYEFFFQIEHLLIMIGNVTFFHVEQSDIEKK